MYKKNQSLFPFGFGLTYTSFIYSGLKVDKKSVSDNEIVNITFDLKNNGDFSSDEVAQLYVSFPDSKVDRPAVALKGYKRVFVEKGETVKVTIPLKATDLTYWDSGKQKFILETDNVLFFIGPSSEDFRLHGNLLTNAVYGPR